MNHPGAVERFLSRQGLLLKDFKQFAVEQSEAVKQHAIDMAERAGRPYEYLRSYKDKDKYVQKILAQNPVEKGRWLVRSSRSIQSSSDPPSGSPSRADSAMR